MKRKKRSPIIPKAFGKGIQGRAMARTGLAECEKRGEVFFE